MVGKQKAFEPTIAIMGMGSVNTTAAPNFPIGTITHSVGSVYHTTGYDITPAVNVNSTARVFAEVEPITIRDREAERREDMAIRLFRGWLSRPKRDKAKRRMAKLSKKRNRR